MVESAKDLPVVFAAHLNWKMAGIINKAEIFKISKEDGRFVELETAFDTTNPRKITIERKLLSKDFSTVTHIDSNDDLLARRVGTERLAFIAQEDLLIRGAGVDFSISAGDALVCGNGGHVGNVSVLKPEDYMVDRVVPVPNWGKLAA